MYTDNFTEPEWLMRPLTAGHEGRQQEWGLSGRGGSHPTPTLPALLPSPATPQALPARAPCHRESLPQKNEHEQEDEEAGGEEQLGWEGRRGWLRD